MPDLSETSGLKRICTAYDCQDCPVNPEDVTDTEDSDYNFSDDDIPAGMGFYFWMHESSHFQEITRDEWEKFTLGDNAWSFWNS